MGTFLISGGILIKENENERFEEKGGPGSF